MPLEKQMLSLICYRALLVPKSNTQLHAFVFIDIPRKNCNQIRTEQMKDDYLREIIKCLEEKGENLHRWLNRGYILNDRILYCYNNDERMHHLWYHRMNEQKS